jgi:hypothetical protein
VATPGTARAKEKQLPRSATITIHKQAPTPKGVVEVTPDSGRVHFKNKDKKSYRLRFFRKEAESTTSIDMLLPANGTVTILIRPGDEFHYMVFPTERVMNGIGGGPIIN